MGLIFPAGAHNETAEHFRCSQHDSSFPHVVQTYINAQHRMLTRQSYYHSAFHFCLKLQRKPHPKILQNCYAGETEPAVGSRSSTSRHLNTTVRRNDKQYRSLSGMHLPFWSPWGITSHKTLPPPVAKASPSNQRCEGAKMPCPY